MKGSLSCFNMNVGAAEPSLRQRCFRTVNGVACSWVLLGSGLEFWTMDMHTRLWEKLRFAALGCDFAALAIYSVMLPLYYVTRKMDEPG